MRALYFLIAGATVRFRYLRPGLAVILAAVAAKLLLADVYAFPHWASPAFIAAVLAAVILLSVRDARGARPPSGRHAEHSAPAPKPDLIERWTP
jgi:predicted tellurium resistance membrane protein TerC